jgi:hypothetical protein
MSTLGLNLEFRNSDQFRELIARDHQKYGTVIREAGSRPNRLATSADERHPKSTAIARMTL